MITANKASDIFTEDNAPPTKTETSNNGNISMGNRFSELSRFAGRVVKRLGATEKAFNELLMESQKCADPLEDADIGKIWRRATALYGKKSNQSGYIPPEKYKTLYALMPPNDDYTELGEARVFAFFAKDNLAYTPETGFLVYDGKKWVESDIKAEHLAKLFLDEQLQDAKLLLEGRQNVLINTGISEDLVKRNLKALKKVITPGSNEDFDALLLAQKYCDWCISNRTCNKIKALLTTVRSMVEVDMKLLNGNPFLLNCPDATYDLRNGMQEKKEHQAGDYLTLITGCAPSDEGKDLWLSALDKFFSGNQDLINYVQCTVGLCAIGQVFQESITICYGDGRNGKSTFWNAISGVLDEYSSSLSAETITGNAKYNVRPEIAELFGKRLVIAAELEEGVELSPSMVKKLCSTDKIAAEKKYKAPFTFIPTHSIVVYTNHLPKVAGTDEGIWRRLIVIPFLARIEGSSEMKNYAEYLVRNAGPYIMKWIIEGAQRVIDSDFKVSLPKIVSDAINDYRSDSNWLDEFLYDCCTVATGLVEASGKLYAEYKEYCRGRNETAKDTRTFYAELKKNKFERIKKKNGSFIIGLQLKRSF